MTSHVGSPTPNSTAIPLPCLELDCYITPSSLYSSLLLARPSLLANFPQFSTYLYIPLRTSAQHVSLEPPDITATSPTQDPNLPNQTNPYNSCTTAFLLHFYSFFDTSAPYPPATHRATATPPGYHDVFPTSVGPRDLGRRIRFIGTPTPYQIRSRSKYATHPTNHPTSCGTHLPLILPLPKL
jgi:hypothetical protein